MTDSAPTTAERTTPQRHRVADLLTDEMRARVRAARFVQTRLLGIRALTGVRHEMLCPLAVALDLTTSGRTAILKALGIGRGDRRALPVLDFIRWADRPESDPADVYVMLGVEPPDGVQ